VVRTLVLFDGQRVVTSNPNAGGPPAIGGVDLSTIPSSIIERVDVVTGGASAAWGSDAVAGVVNLVINKHYTGMKANVVFGNDSSNDHKSYKAEFTVGTGFLGGRAHTEFAANYTMSPDTFYAWNRPWYNNNNRALYPCSVVNGGAANALCHTPSGVYTDSFTNGGLITASAASASGSALTAIQNIGGQFATAGSAGTPTAANALKGIQFVGPNAQQVPFNFGVNSGSNCYACSSNFNTDVANAPIQAVPYHQLNLFSYTSYNITNNISASVMLNYGWNAEQNQANDGRQSQVNVKVDNAFIPAALQQQLIAQGIPSFSLGTAAIENLAKASDVSMKNLGLSIAQNYVQNYRQLMRGVFTLNGGYSLFGEDWSWNAYAQNSSVRERQWARLNTMNTNFSNAVDAVVVQATGPNSLGGGNATNAAAVRGVLTAAGVPIPAVGSIACRSTLTQTLYGVTTSPTSGFQVLQPGGLTPGCVPLNLFGDGTVSQAALNYIAPGRVNTDVSDRALYRMSQSVFSISTQGTLPWGLAAGKPAVSFGFEDRLEQQRNQRDPLELGASGVFESGNFSEYAGQYNVQEGFLEVTVPILKNDIVDSLELNGAGRITSYSTSGLVETWKLGATSQINEDIKLRTTLSSDIRAPGIGELFTNTLVSTQTLSYPNGGPTFNVHQLQGGNPLLVPEQAETVSGGIVLTPHWIENLSMSFDWYSITLHNGIFAPSEGQIAGQCAGAVRVASFCQLLFFAKGFPGNSSLPVAAEVDGNGVSPPPALLAAIGNTTFSADSEGAFNAYLQAPVNANRETTSGLDFQLDYMHELFDGTMNWHILGNYTDEKTRTSLGVTVDGAGAVSSDGSLNPLTGFTEPKLRATVTSTYTEGAWSVTAQARIIGSAVLTNNLTQGQAAFVSIDNNSVPAVIYGDFRGSYRWNDHIQLYGAVDNTFNAPPPNIPTIGGGGYSCIIYDCIGRAYRVGVRFEN
jgi:outer membrane receptor protein involved in Fe transport